MNHEELSNLVDSLPLSEMYLAEMELIVEAIFEEISYRVYNLTDKADG